MASKSTKANSSRIPNFFKLDIDDRIRALYERGLLTDSDLHNLLNGQHTLKRHVADKMIENVIGVLGLPLGLGLNFLVNGKDYVIPLSVEEPSIVAGLSGAARTARLSGGFESSSSEPILIGQVQIVNLDNPKERKKKLLDNKKAVLNLANSLHPKMVARGGGARDIEVFQHTAPEDGREMLVVHLLVDTRDAMGANLVNSMCEGVASLLESISGGKVFLRILSNLTDKAIVKSKVRIPIQNLEVKGFSGAEVRDGIILANDLARVDPYRATTHNKGIMNGVDAVAIATGNDFRAIEAAAHAYAARDGQYRALTIWKKNTDGDLIGELEIPMKVGTVGGSLENNPTVRINHRILGTPDAKELATIMGTVGLAQNYAALRSLATSGIQQNHMTLHARSVASSANVPAEHFDTLVEKLIESGDIKVWKAREILMNLSRQHEESLDESTNRSSACGKVILLGEHSVVYGRPALAAPIPLAVEARVIDAHETTLLIPRWGVEQRIKQIDEHPQGITGILALLLSRLSLSDRSMRIEVFPSVPRAMGLGGSAALAVAVIRALSNQFHLNLSNERINELAFECEEVAHGTPSGVDNTIATFGTALRYQNRQGKATFEEIHPSLPIPFLVGISGKESLTASTVAQVRNAWMAQPKRYEGIFDQIAELTNAGVDALREGSLSDLGEIMNVCHGYLNALQISTPEIEELIHIARRNGAAGAKLTGGGGGGSIVAVCPNGTADAEKAIRAAGYDVLTFDLS